MYIYIRCNINARRMYWRRASVQDGQAFTRLIIPHYCCKYWIYIRICLNELEPFISTVKNIETMYYALFTSFHTGTE